MPCKFGDPDGGTSVTCYIPIERRVGGKNPSQRKSFHGVLMGYETNSPAYRVWDIAARKIRVVSYNFTICHEGFYPFKEKANWPSECVGDPAYFSPKCGGVFSSAEWKKYDYDEEESMEARSDRCLFNHPWPEPQQVSLETQATGCVTPAKEPRITGPAWCQIETQCLTDSLKNQLQGTIHPDFNSGVNGVEMAPHAYDTRSKQKEREKEEKNKNAVNDSRAENSPGLPNFENSTQKHTAFSPPTSKLLIDAPESKMIGSTKFFDQGEAQPSKTHQFWSQVLSRYNVGNFLRTASPILSISSTPNSEEFLDKPVGIPPPKTLREARLCPWWPQYKKAAKIEFDGHQKSGTWKLVPKSSIPPGRSLLRGKWVFDDKRDESGKIVKFKARFVAMGFTQKYGIDYQETFAGGKSFRIMLVILNEDPSHEMDHWDVRMAFTQAKLEEEIYMHQPELFEENPEEMVCRLIKSLYGLKQAAKNWREMLKKMFLAAGFTPLFCDPCVYVR